MFDKSISFIIPAFNEAENIEQVIRTTHSYLSQNFKQFEIIVVDDGSTDETKDICLKLVSDFKGTLSVLTHSANRGYGAALRTGLYSGKFDLVFYTDADNQFDISELSMFMNHIDTYDIVIGYRKDRKDVWRRRFASKVYNRLIYFLFKLSIKDIDCSFKLFRREALHSLSIDTDEFLVDTEMLLKAKLKKLRITELPVTHYPRLAGQSTVKLHHIMSTLRDIHYVKNKIQSEGLL